MIGLGSEKKTPCAENTVCALKRVLDNPTDMNKPVRGCHVIEGYLILIGNLGDTEEV